MEARRITVVSTKNQTKKVIMSSAETLAELKADLRQNGIDYSGMTFYEGLSKTELKDVIIREGNLYEEEKTLNLMGGG